MDASTSFHTENAFRIRNSQNDKSCNPSSYSRFIREWNALGNKSDKAARCDVIIDVVIC